MTKVQRERRVKIAILVLSVLLALSLIALAAMAVYRHVAGDRDDTVTVPNNIITPETTLSAAAFAARTIDTEEGTAESASVETHASAKEDETTAPPAETTAFDREADVLSLYKWHAEDNKPFRAENLFPGDKETKYYCVKVSYRDSITVHFKAEVRRGYDKLAEVLDCKVKLLNTGEVLYEGLMRDMPDSLDHTLTADGAATEELYYEITASLDTSVGNEYQDKDLVADFRFWVEETEHLEPSPETGERVSTIILWGVALGAGFFLLMLLASRRREKEYAE